MKKLLLLPIIFIFYCCTNKASLSDGQISKTEEQIGFSLKNGPMLGYSTMKEAVIWVQASQDGIYYISYTDEEGIQYKTNDIVIDVTKDDTALFKADKLSPGRTYEYQVITKTDSGSFSLGNGKFQSQPLWQWRNDPPAFDFAFGSCSYINEPTLDRPGKPYGNDYQIFESIYEKQPDFMVWGGDNTYLREADWDSMTGIKHRYTHSRQIPQLKGLLANTHNYAIWDDHDYGPNDSDRSYHLKDSTLKAFKEFWANPSYGINGKPGITSKFQWNDCEFFLLDNRYYRTPNNRKSGERFILGKEQIDWLIDNLVNSKASFKFIVVGGQVVNTASVFENHATFGEERQLLLDLIQEEQIKNVIFLTGDRHHSEISIIENDVSPTIIDITSSPLTSGSHEARDEGNIYQKEGSFIHQRNFAIISISGKWGERSLKLQYFDVNGDLIYYYQMQQE